MNVIVGRYLLYSFIALEVLLLPKLLDETVYTEVEYYKFILYFIPFFLFGANSGFVYFKYNHEKDYFTSLLVFGFAFSLFYALCLFLYSGSLLIAASAVIMILFVIIEQRVKTEKEFILAIAIKPVVSIALLLFVGASYYNGFEYSSVEFLFSAFLMGFLIWFACVLYRVNSQLIVNYRVSFHNFIKLIRKGFVINMATLLLMAVFFTDRYFTKEFYPDYLGTYSFSYNLVQFVVLALTTLAYTNTVSIGESIKNISIGYLRKKIFYAYKVFLIMYLLFVVFLWVITMYYDFISLMEVSLVMGLLIGNFFALNSVGTIAQYKDFQLSLTIFMLFIAALNLLLSYVFVSIGAPYLIFILKAGLLLNVYSLYFMRLVYKNIESDIN